MMSSVPSTASFQAFQSLLKEVLPLRLDVVYFDTDMCDSALTLVVLGKNAASRYNKFDGLSYAPYFVK